MSDDDELTDDELRELQATLEELEDTDPDVKAAADNYHAAVARILARPLCDYRHPDGRRPADWGYSGESGDYYVCDWHFQQLTDDGKRNWHRIEPER